MFSVELQFNFQNDAKGIRNTTFPDIYCYRVHDTFLLFGILLLFSEDPQREYHLFSNNKENLFAAPATNDHK